MARFRKIRDGKKGIMVGFDIYQPDYDIINLFCFANQLTRSAFFRMLISEWRSRFGTRSQLRAKISRMYIDKWYHKKLTIYVHESMVDLDRHHKQFCKQTKEELELRGISSEDIDLILEKIKL